MILKIWLICFVIGLAIASVCGTIKLSENTTGKTYKWLKRINHYAILLAFLPITLFFGSIRSFFMFYRGE